MSATSGDDTGDGFDGALDAAKQQLRGAPPKPKGGSGGGGNVTRLPPPPHRDRFEGSGVVPIGTYRGIYYVIDRLGVVRELAAREMLAKPSLLDIFGAEDGWLGKEFGRETKGGGLDVQWDQAGQALMRACHAWGLFDPAVTPIRKPGIWVDADGRPLLHLGNVLMFADGGTETAGRKIAEDVYERGPALRGPADLPSHPADLAELCADIAALWRFRDGPAAAMLALGWCAMASLGGLAEWRSNLLVLGESGWGKTSLLNLLRALCPLHSYSNDPSKAGLEGTVSDRPGPIVVEEAPQGDRLGAQSLFDMSLSATGGEGTVGRRGMPDGRIRSFRVLGAFCYGAIHPPPLRAEHQGRFTELVLRPPERYDPDEMRALRRRAHALGPSVLRRVLLGHDRWPGNLGVFRAELVRRGASPREADQLGGLLAGWWLLASDAVAAPAEAQDCVGEAIAYLGGQAAQRDDSTGRRAWVMLVTTSLMVRAGNARVPVGELVRGLWSTDIGTQAHAELELQRIGIRRDSLSPLAARARLRGAWRDDEIPAHLWPVRGLWFGRNHQELRRLFHGSEFAGEAWWRAMEALPLARRSKGNVRIGSYPGGAFFVPMHVLDLPEDFDAPAPPDGSDAEP